MEGQLREVALRSGLILSLDGLAPEGGEPQLWVVRELTSGLTLRSGWLAKQDEGAFVNFLAADCRLETARGRHLERQAAGTGAGSGRGFSTGQTWFLPDPLPG